MSSPTCPTCGGCRVASLRWTGGDRWTAEPCPDCRPSESAAALTAKDIREWAAKIALGTDNHGGEP